MGTLWLGGAEGLIARNCTQIAGADTGFPEGGGGISQAPPPPLGHCLRDVIRPPENWKTPPLLDIHKHPPLGHCPRDVIRPPENWKTPPLPPLLLPQKRTAAAQKTELPKSWGAAAPPAPPASYAYGHRPICFPEHWVGTLATSTLCLTLPEINDIY